MCCGCSEEKGLFRKGRVDSIILREKHGAPGAVGLRHNPKPRALDGSVHRENPGPFLQGPVVGSPILRRQLTPISSLVALYASEDVVLGYGCQSIRCGNNPAKPELGYGKHFCAH